MDKISTKVALSVYVIGTVDTKKGELLFVKSLLVGALPRQFIVQLVDVSTKNDSNIGDITPSFLLSTFGKLGEVKNGDRGDAVTRMSEALRAWFKLESLNSSVRICGVIGLGGSGGTALITQAMQILPIGVPKVMLSTVASGDTKPLIGTTDLTLMYSVTDIQGLNEISRTILGNAAHALAGMVQFTIPKVRGPKKTSLGLTMFGVTTECVSNVSKSLEEDEGTECIIFHATGTGGQSMFKLVQEKRFDCILDLTTTEYADHLMGGIMSAGPDRIKPIADSKIPYIGSVGALDMVNFGRMDTVPSKYKDRLFHVHNQNITLMRTTFQENTDLGKHIAMELNECSGPVVFLLPLQGISAMDKEGMPFYDPEADQALFQAIESNLIQTDNRKLIKVDCHINDTTFSDMVLLVYKEMIKITDREKMSHILPKELPSKSFKDQQIEEYLSSRYGAFPTKLEHMKSFYSLLKTNQAIVGGGAGIGLSAKQEELAGIDLIILYNSGRYRMAGRGSLSGLLAYGNANQIVLEMANEILTVVKKTPVLAGVNATDPFIQIDLFLKKLKKLGFAGVQNFPTVGLIDGVFRTNLEETGMTYQQEVDMIQKANQIGLITTPYVFSSEDAINMTKAGADIIVCHLGLTTGGNIGAITSKTLDDCVDIIDEWTASAQQVNPFVLVLCHGGPISSPEDAAYIIKHCKSCHGFYGASSMERLPTEVAIADQIQQFKRISF